MRIAWRTILHFLVFIRKTVILIQLQKKQVLTNATLLHFVIIVPIIGKLDLTFHVFPKDPLNRSLVSPLSTF